MLYKSLIIIGQLVLSWGGGRGGGWGGGWARAESHGHMGGLDLLELSRFVG